jgi:hypothetical protein
MAATVNLLEMLCQTSSTNPSARKAMNAVEKVVVPVSGIFILMHWTVGKNSRKSCRSALLKQRTLPGKSGFAGLAYSDEKETGLS